MASNISANFDPYDKSSWDFGAISRKDATSKLMSEKVGVFLVRSSTSVPGDFVLCVREEEKVGHYIINGIQRGGNIWYRIGDQMFPDIPSLLSFYVVHYLTTTTLVKPAPKDVELVRAKFDFERSDDPDDLLFRKGEILTVISKDEEKWWMAKNSKGRKGFIPVSYVEQLEKGQLELEAQAQGCFNPNSGASAQSNSAESNRPTSSEVVKYSVPASIQRKLPAMAKVKQARVPNAYDNTALKLEVGDIIKVTKMNINGQWEGELKDKTGHFPFTHVEFIDTDSAQDFKSACSKPASPLGPMTVFQTFSV